jgi:hypothetical protein
LDADSLKVDLSAETVVDFSAETVVDFSAAVVDFSVERLAKLTKENTWNNGPKQSGLVIAL